MQKITIKELVEFRKRTDKSRKNFAAKLKSREVKEKTDLDLEGSGGDYWVTSTSCIYNVFKNNNDSLYDAKVDELRARQGKATDIRIKTMYQRNIDIISSFKDFEFSDLKPSSILKYETAPKEFKLLTIHSIPVFVNPSLLFSFENNGKTELGALWLVPKLAGFKKAELGMFCEALYKFLIKNYSDKYQISPNYCIAIDTFSAQKVIYTNLEKGEIPFLIDKTLKEINDL